MIEFAKLHVKAALKEASEKSMVEADKDWIIESLTIYPRQLVDRVNIKVNKESILDSYPLENIK